MKKSQVEFGPEVPNYAVLNEALKHQKNLSTGEVAKQRKPKKPAKPDAQKPS